MKIQKGSFFWIIFISFSIIVIIFNNLRNTQYQVASFGKTGAIIVDKQSGEAWITDSYEIGSKQTIYLKPVGYCGYQKNNWTYKADEKKSNKNTTWLIWFKRKLFNSP